MERPITASLFTAAEGEAYAPFIPRWWESVQQMDPPPDEIVISIHPLDKASVRDVVAEDDRVRLVEIDEPFSNKFFREACAATTSTWVSFSGVDDVMLPYAYADIAEATEVGADIIVGTIALSNGSIWRGSWNPYEMRYRNTLPAHSPYRKSLWEKVGGFPDIRWSDWGFWLKCLREDPVIFVGTRPIAIFDIGEGRQTMSGVDLAATTRAEADRELLEFLETL